MIEAPDLATVKLSLRVDGDDLDSEIARNIETATTLANRQAPDAPESVGQEAIIRMTAYLFEGPDGIGQTNAAAWRRSGAEGLLSPWTVRRAGLVKA